LLCKDKELKVKRLKLLGVVLAALWAMGLMATSAFALPDISVTLGSTYPLHLNYLSETIETKLESAAAILEGKGLHILYLIGTLTSLGTFRAIFLNVVNGENKAEKCLSTANEGEVLTEGEFHIVYTSLSPLTLGTLYLPKEITITCPGVSITIKVKGSVIGAIRFPSTNENEQLTGLKNLLTGTGGKQQFRAYENESGGKLLAQLLCNKAGTGFKECNQVVGTGGEEPEATALESKKFVVTKR
jgi:hypothetical protein